MHRSPLLNEQERELEDLRRAKAELLRQLEEYQIIFNSMPIMLWYKDAKNNIIFINRAAGMLEGVPAESLSGKSCWDVYPKEQADAFYADDMQVVNSGSPKLGIIEQHTSPKTGKVMWVQTGKVPYRDRDGKIVGVIAFAVDITEQKEAEQKLRQAHNEMQRAQEFFSATLEQLTEAVQRGSTSSEMMKYLKEARAEFERLS